MQAEPTHSSAAERILDAAYAVFAERGFAAASSLAIATRAHVSKRSLYEAFGSKTGLLVALIERRTAAMTAPLQSPAAPRTPAELADALRRFGETLLPGLTQPSTLTMMRLAVAEAERAPELARQIDIHGRKPVAEAMRALLQGAAAAGLIPTGSIEAVLGAYFGMLQGNLILSLLLRLRPSPEPGEIAALAKAATQAALAVASASVTASSRASVVESDVGERHEPAR